ncbi:MAG: DUF2726 domain-containing protein [Undibacterium sp.]|nr:DUF2726 domain-containing protein [Undibacterium sp.]
MFSHFLGNGSKTHTTYQKHPLFSPEEARFFKRLRKLLPNCHIFPRVPLSSLIQVQHPQEKQKLSLQSQLDSLWVDFAIFNRSFDLLCVVDLEHEQKSNEQSVRPLLIAANIKSLCWEKQRLPSHDQMQRTLAPYIEQSLQAISKSKISKIPYSSTIGNRTIDYNDTLSLAYIEHLTPSHRIQKDYPHIWNRICLLAGNSVQLEHYLHSLFLDVRGTPRMGLPEEVAQEVRAIQAENSRFIQQQIQLHKPPAKQINGWDSNFCA